MDLGGASSASIQQNRIKRLTFDHLSGGDGIDSTLQMTGCIIEHKESFGQAIPSGKCKSTYLVLMCLETFFKSLLRQKVVRHFK